MAPLLLAAVGLGGMIGLALGMLGGGGSILTVPILVYLLNQDAHAAVTTSLVIVGANALIGAWLHQRQGHVHLRVALLFGLYGVGTAYLGARLSNRLPSGVLLLLFALLMLAVAALMIRGSATAAPASSTASPWWLVVLGGATVGFLTGFLGVGGGFLIVPALVLLLGMPMREAVGSSLVVIVLNSTAGLAGHLTGGSLNWTLIALLLSGGLPGIFLGAWLARRLPTQRLRQSFAIVVVVLAVTLLATNLHALVTERTKAASPSMTIIRL